MAHTRLALAETAPPEKACELAKYGYHAEMTPTGVIIVGSGPAGVAAAESFREYNADTPLRIISADIDPPYARPPLSKEFLRGETDDVDLHPAGWFDDRSIELVGGARIDRLDLAEHTVFAGDQRYGYDSLILACGAAPVTPPFPGGERALLLRSYVRGGVPLCFCTRSASTGSARRAPAGSRPRGSKGASPWHSTCRAVTCGCGRPARLGAHTTMLCVLCAQAAQLG